MYYCLIKCLNAYFGFRMLDSCSCFQWEFYGMHAFSWGSCSWSCLQWLKSMVGMSFLEILINSTKGHLWIYIHCLNLKGCELFGRMDGYLFPCLDYHGNINQISWGGTVFMFVILPSHYEFAMSDDDLCNGEYFWHGVQYIMQISTIYTTKRYRDP